MNRLVQISWAAFALAGAACFISIAWYVAALPPVPNLAPMARHADGVLTRLEGIESKANATLINIDDGTKVWSSSAKEQAASIKELTGSAGAVIEETKLAIGDARSLVRAGTEQVKTVGPLLDSLRTTSDAAQPVLGQLALTTAASTRAIDALNGRLRDKRVDELMDHIKGMSDSGDKMLADAQWKEHQLLHPDKRKLGFWGGTWAGFQYVRTEVLPKVTLF